MKRQLFLFAMSWVLASAHAQNCESVIALSKTTESQVSDKESIEQQAANFCSDYKRSVQSGSSMDAGGSYGMFSASVGMSNQSAEAVATKYCSSQENYAASKFAYRSYVESISPKAYSAYERCLELSKRDLKFNVDPAAILPDEFSISASFISTVGKPKTTLEISSSGGVSCSAGGQSVTLVDVKTGSTVAISCKRADKTKAAYVSLINRDSGSPDPLTLPWQAFTAQGVPADSLLKLQQRINGLESQISRTGVQSGVLILKAVGTRPLADTSSCPAAPDAYRGEMNGRVAFTKPFAEPPHVSIGLSSMDIGGGQNNGQRLAVQVQKVDRTGFTYSFYTWCNTAIAGATASWMAAAKQ